MYFGYGNNYKVLERKLLNLKSSLKMTLFAIRCIVKPMNKQLHSLLLASLLGLELQIGAGVGAHQ
jgi:hypothetical protein